MLSLANVVVGLSTSAVVIAAYPTSRVVAAAAALVGWQLAYTLDCADGQLARSTNQASSVGALLDIACDYVVQVGVVVALVVVAADSVPSAVAAPVAVAIGGGWLLAPFYAAIGGAIERPLGYEVLRRRLVLVKQVRDYGLQIGVFPVLMLVGSLPVALGLAVVAVANLSFLVVRLAGLKPLARVR
jgi:phosphatidylglycerophosphate synthase